MNLSDVKLGSFGAPRFGVTERDLAQLGRVVPEINAIVLEQADANQERQVSLPMLDAA